MGHPINPSDNPEANKPQQQPEANAKLAEAAAFGLSSKSTYTNICDLNLNQDQVTAINKLPQTDTLETVLYDIAKAALIARSKITGEVISQDGIYQELNRIMVLNGYQKANIDDKVHITDHNLPKSWNHVVSHQKFRLYGSADDPLGLNDGRVTMPNPFNPVNPFNPFNPTSPTSPFNPLNPAQPPGNPINNPGNNPVTKPGDGSGDKSDTSIDMMAIVRALEAQHKLAQDGMHKDESVQGFLGKTYDGLKNVIGASDEDRSWYNPAALWSNVLNYDKSSSAIENKLKSEEDKLKKLEDAAEHKDLQKFKNIYKDITGHELNPAKGAGKTKLADAASVYDSSQYAGVDTISDIAAASTAIISLRFGEPEAMATLLKTVGAGIVLGGTTKASLMQLDGHYAHLGRDLAIGAIWGGTAPISELAGVQTSRMIGAKWGLTVTGDLLAARIETQGAGLATKFLSASAKSGVAGSVFGAIESPVQTIVQNHMEGKSSHVSGLLKDSLQGATMGFLGSVFLGVAFDAAGDGFKNLRPGMVTDQAPKIINGVPVPASGVTSIEDAATMLGTKPEEFVLKAKANPYGAVDDAVSLYDQAGINIKKVDPLTGKSLVPEEFADALSSVQKVDGLTADAAMPLKGKAGIVKQTVDFLKTKKAETEDFILNLKGNQTYKDILDLKQKQGGAEAANEFEQNIQSGFQKDLKTSMSVDQIRSGQVNPDKAYLNNKGIVEGDYTKKVSDIFKDMTDPKKKLELEKLVDDIYAKFNPELLSKANIEKIINDVPEDDRKLAIALLAESSVNASDTVLKAQLQSVKADIAQTLGGESPGNVYTLAPNSSGNFLGYLYRKSNGFSMDIRNIDSLNQNIASGSIPNKIVLFDDLSTTAISPQQKDFLAAVPNVYVVDLGAFEKSINVLDVAKGPEAVAEKLDKLLAEAKIVSANNPGLIPTGVAQRVLSGSVDKAAAAIGHNVKVIRSTVKLQLPYMPSEVELSSMEPVDALYHRFNVPKTSKEDIAKFLSKYSGNDRVVAASMLADGAVHNSFPVMMAKAVQVHNQLAQTFAKSGMSMKDLLLVSDKDPGGSTHLISYLFGKANGLTSDNFISTQKLNQLISSGGAGKKAIAYFDDTIYSGSQTTSLLQGNVSSFMPFKKVIIGSLGAYEQGINSIKGTHLASIGKVDIASATVHQPFFSAKHTFYSSLSPQAQSIAKNIGGSNGFGSIQGSLIWSYMYPDNNLEFFGHKFSGNVLKLPCS